MEITLNSPVNGLLICTFAVGGAGEPSNPQKRTKTSLRAKLNKKEAHHKQRLGRRRILLRQQRLRKLPHREPGTWDVFSAILRGERTSSEPPADTCADALSPEEEAHGASLAESRRKLDELERDQPLWEAEKRKREAREQAEAEEQRKRKAHEQAEIKEQENQQRHAAEEAAAKAAYAKVTAAAQELDDTIRLDQYFFDSRQRQIERWCGPGRWTHDDAFRRYEEMSAAFDAAKFDENNPPDFYEIPWPVLFSPCMLQPVDISWVAVEAFFATAVTRFRFKRNDYRLLVEQTHKRFHPDRWRARKVVKSLDGFPALREWTEEAGKIVSQAVTPIWREVKGK